MFHGSECGRKRDEDEHAFMITAFEIYNFAYDRSESFREWSFEVFRKWFSYMYSKNLTAVVTKDDRIIAMAVARPVSSREQAENQYLKDDQGEICYVDMAVCEPKYKQVLLEEMFFKIGCKKFIAFRRGDKSKALKIYKMEKFIKLFWKDKIYGQS